MHICEKHCDPIDEFDLHVQFPEFDFKHLFESVIQLIGKGAREKTITKINIKYPFLDAVVSDLNLSKKFNFALGAFQSVIQDAAVDFVKNLKNFEKMSDESYLKWHLLAANVVNTKGHASFLAERILWRTTSQKEYAGNPKKLDADRARFIIDLFAWEIKKRNDHLGRVLFRYKMRKEILSSRVDEAAPLQKCFTIVPMFSTKIKILLF